MFLEYSLIVEYIKYFKETYVCRTDDLGFAQPPTYAVESWNSFDAVLRGDPTTNNAVEGWHHVFNSSFGKARLPLSQFVVRMKMEEEKTVQLATR